MKLKAFTAAAVMIALSAAPAVASNVAASALSLTPAAETIDGSQQADTGTWIIVGLGLVAAGAGIWALADGGDEGKKAPVSP